MLFNHQNFLQLDDTTFSFASDRIEEFEKMAYNEVVNMSPNALAYDDFTPDGCAYCGNVEMFLKQKVFMRFYPELDGSLEDLMNQDNITTLYNLTPTRSKHVQ